MNTLELITNAYYLSGILSRGFETISDEQTADGLELLNDVIAERAINSSYIPYFSHTTFNTVPGQEIYDIDGLVDLATLTFNINDVRYHMTRDNQNRYFGGNRVDNIRSLPFHYYAERQEGNQTLIYLYFVPDQVYEMKITGKYALSELTLFETLTMDRFYISYLKYKLAQRICEYYQTSFSQISTATLSGLENKINKMVGTDLTVNRRGGQKKINYAFVNINSGWWPT
jgi:hypothetical protein